MIKLKWGEIPYGTIVFDAATQQPQMVLTTTQKSVSVLNLYSNRIARKRPSTQANVVFKQVGGAHE